MHAARPHLPPEPCAACGADVDPIRAAEVLAMSDGYRYLCDRECRARFVKGDRAKQSARPPAAPRARRDPATGIIHTRDPRSLEPLTFVQPEPRPEPEPPWLAFGAAAIGAVLGGFGASPALALASGAASITSVVLAVMAGRETVRDIGYAAWLAAPAGACLATFGAVLATVEDPSRWPALVGAAIAGALVAGRVFLDEKARRPVQDAVDALSALLPPRLRMPVQGNSRGELSLAEVDTAVVRVGEEVLVIAGEAIPVDGIVEGGEGEVLSHPAARLPVIRRAGDPVLAGARVTSGALRLRATRVGPDRALARVASFGGRDDRRARARSSAAPKA